MILKEGRLKINNMKINKILVLITIAILLLYVILYPFKGDMTLRFSSIFVANSLHGFLYENIKLRKLNAIISLIFLIILSVLGFGFDYFKY
jgi:hypothetical protein